MRSALGKCVALAVLALVACGKRGDPKPPVPVIPKATSDLVVTQRGPRVILSWSFPALTTSGKSLTGVKRVIVYRYTEELPVPQTGRDPNAILPGDVDSTAPPAIQQFAKIPSLSPTQFAKLKEKLDSMESANFPASTNGAKLTYEDTPSFHSADGRPVRIDYAVVTEGQSARGDLSNVVNIVPIDVPVAPAALTATPKPEGVVLSWTAPTSVVTGGSGKPVIVGYDIFRNSSGQSPDELSVAINTAPVNATTYTDVPTYGSYDYRVAAVSSTSQPRIASDLSSPVSATYKDLLPPPAPASVTALVETKQVRLVWDPVEAPDLAGYKVRRIEGVGIGEPKEVGGFFIVATPQMQTNYTDADPNKGIAYRYEVVAVDKSGNVSAPAKTGWVVVPKTP